MGDFCTYSTIQAAIDAAASGDTILVQGKTFPAAIDISGKSLILLGGYDSACAALTGTRTLLDATGLGDSAIEINGQGVIRTVEIDSFEVTGGEADPDFGGGLEIDQATVTLRDSIVHDNASARGGGAHVSFGGTLILDDGTLLRDNLASVYGGGIFCEGGGVEIRGDSAVGFWLLEPFPNSSANVGGGLALNDCPLTLDADQGFTATVSSNTAAAEGGGIYAWGSSIVTLNGHGASVTGNSAGESTSGGGIQIYDDSTLQMHNGVIDGNVAERGGGIAVEGTGGAASVDLRGDSAYACSAVKCAEVSHNLVTSYGGGIYLHDGATAQFISAWAEENEAAIFGSAFYLSRASSLTLESVMVTGGAGGGVAVLRLDNLFAPTQTQIRGSTFAGNQANGVFSVLPGSTLSAESLVVWGNDGPMMDGDATIDCSILQEAHAGTGNLVADPQFVSPASGDYRLRVTSPAIDHCSTGYGMDVELEARPFDLLGTDTDYDAGADEVRPLFADGFESGDTSAWSAVPP